MFHFPQMANSNSITHSFASKAALSAATSLNRVRMRNIFTFKSFASFFSCLSWKEVALGHLHIYTATDPQKLIVNKLPTFCWGHIFISWGGKSWMLIFSVNWTWSISHLENLMFLWWRAKSKWLTHPTITPNHQSCGL